jgi:hypothetical protein
MQPCVQDRELAQGLDNINCCISIKEGKPAEMQQLQYHKLDMPPKQDFAKGDPQTSATTSRGHPIRGTSRISERQIHNRAKVEP